MRSIKASFKKEKSKATFHSSFICLGRAVAGRKFNTDRISRNLTNLVEKDDYIVSDRPALLRHLITLTNSAKRTGNA